MLLIAVSLAGCQQATTPDQVAAGFSSAMKSGNSGDVRKFVSSHSANNETLGEDVLAITDVQFGKIIIDGEVATVETTVSVESDSPVTVPLATRLVRENSQWKVDYDATVGSIEIHSDLAMVLRRIREYGEGFADQLNDSLDDMQQALPEIERELRNMEDSLKTQIPELQRRIEAFAKSLEEAIVPKDGATAPATPPAEQDQIAL
jgi:hypothetical protein